MLIALPQQPCSPSITLSRNMLPPAPHIAAGRNTHGASNTDGSSTHNVHSRPLSWACTPLLHAYQATSAGTSTTPAAAQLHTCILALLFPTCPDSCGPATCCHACFNLLITLTNPQGHKAAGASRGSQAQQCPCSCRPPAPHFSGRCPAHMERTDGCSSSRRWQQQRQHCYSGSTGQAQSAADHAEATY